MDREDSPEPVSNPAVLGYLRYVDRKSGEVKQHYPIDAERITFGRDPDCDIRLHWDDVSRVHAEIQFDLLEGSATLVVVGSNGLYFTPDNQPRIKLEPSARQTLSTGDSFIIRKKLFFFEYPAHDLAVPVLSPSILNTPIRSRGTPAKPSMSSTPLRRRASHRMSLLPSDKPFVPLSPMKRRQSNAGQTGSTPKRSHLSNAVEEDEEDEIMEGIVDVQQGEDGDMIVLETRDETPKVMEKPEAVPPKTPRSIPLPLPAQTPYVHTPPRVPSKVAMSTPPGPMTLHKALLLRSARKAWVESRPNDVDDAVADGKIEVARRKSKSPSKEEESRKRKSLTPRPGVAQPDSDISDDEEEEAIAAGRAGLQWVQVDPMAEASFVESDSAEDSLEADFSLDIPGQGVLDFGLQGDVDAAEDDEDESYDDEEDHESLDSEQENRHQEEQEQPLNDVDEQQDEEMEEEDLFESAAQSTPVNVSLAFLMHRLADDKSRTLDRFYTPQVPRQQNQPRRSLASIGGPAIRVLGVPASPNPLGGGAFRPTPSKSLSMPLPASFEQDEEDEAMAEEVIRPVQSSISDHELAEIKKRRQSLATPRRLPAPPMSFKEPIKTPFSLVKTGHPALNRSLTRDGEEHENDGTPMGDIRARLNKMKRDASVREQSRAGKDGRRATVGFVLPETPARPVIQASASYTAAPATRFADVAPPTPGTPVMRPYEDEGDSGISSLNQTPVRSAVKKVGTPFTLIRRTPIQEAAEVEEEAAEEVEMIQSSPLQAASTTPVKRNGAPRQQRQEPKTPYMGDIRNLYPTIPSPASPVLSGIKNLYPSLPLPPKTPDMRGMKGMFAESARSAATPGMEGLEEMFASPARNFRRIQQAEQVEEDVEVAVALPVEVEAVQYRSPRVSRRSSVKPREEHKEAEAVQEEEASEAVVVQELQAPSRPTPVVAGEQAAPVEAEPKPTKSIPSRAPRTAKPIEAKSAPTRTRAPTADKPVEADKSSTSTRRRAAGPVAAPIPATETRSKLSRRAPAAPTEPTPAEEATLPSKASRSRTVSAKAPTAGPSTRPASPEAKSAPTRGRPKKVLVEAPEQPAVAIETKPPAAATAKPARTRTAAAVAPVATVERRTVSAPTRRTRAAKEDGEGEKENVAEEKSAPSRASKARGMKRDTGAVVEPVISTSRATRSRK